MRQIAKTTLCVLALIPSVPNLGVSASAATFATLYTFSGDFSHDGGNPFDDLAKDNSGNLYGVTEAGNRECLHSCGTIFRFSPQGTLTVLHAFAGGLDGWAPDSVILDKTGALHGVAEYGGKYGWGTVFKLEGDGKRTVKYSFTGGSDGASPRYALLAGKDDAYYGVTTYRGGTGCYQNHGCGTLYKLARNGQLTTLYTFSSSDGYPGSSLISDAAGNLYGTTSGWNPSCGGIFRFTPDGQFSYLLNYCDSPGPEELLMDGSGNLYGPACCSGPQGFGGVFKLAPDGTVTLLHAFSGGTDGEEPYGGVEMDSNGTLYGTTGRGGSNGCGGSGCGTVYKVTAAGVETVLHVFTGDGDGTYPFSTLLKGSGGLLYGTTIHGSEDSCNPGDCGTVFSLKP